MSSRRRYRTGILSNSFVGARERERPAYGFEEICDVVVCSHEEGVKKPERRFYEIVCERLGVRPREAIFPDDVPACVQAAPEVGMSAITFVNNERAIGEIQKRLGEADCSKPTLWAPGQTVSSSREAEAAILPAC